MKKIFFKTVILSACLSLGITGCEKEEIPYFDNQHNAVRFNNSEEYDPDTKIFKGNFSFLELPLDATHGEYTFPLMLIGNVSTENRMVNYEIVEEETTAPTGSFEIVEAQVPANSLKGYVKVKLAYSEDIKNGASYKCCIRLKKSESLGVGPQEYLTATLNWDSSILAPNARDRFLWITYNLLIESTERPTSMKSKAYSSNALKAIVSALDWNDWDDMKAHPDLVQRPTFYKYKYLADYRLLNADQSYKAYAAKLADYLKKYKEQHPDAPLVHNDGIMKGQEIKARKY